MIYKIKMVIYKTTNLINGKFYIGKDNFNVSSYYGSGTLLKKAIKKHGKENFKKEILEECKTNEELNEREKFWIKELNATKEGYNLTDGGDGGDTISKNPRRIEILKQTKKTKKERGVGKGEKNPMYGRKHTDEHKEKISKKLKEAYKTGKIKRYRMTPEGRAKLSNFMKENCPTKTPEGRRKNRENNLGSKNPNAKVYEFTSPDNKIYHVIGNIKGFCKEMEISYNKVIQLHKGNLKEHNGWKCKKLKK